MLKTWQRRAIIVIHDILAVFVAWLVAFWLKFNLSEIPFPSFENALHILPIVLIVQLACCYSFSLYRGYWRYASMPDLQRIIKAVVAGSLISLVLLFFATRLAEVPRSVIPMYAVLAILFLGGSRFTYRYLRDYRSFFTRRERVLIIGAGKAGESLIRDLVQHGGKLYKPVLLLDDDSTKVGREVHGVRVKGLSKDLPLYVDKFDIDLIFIAMPSATSASIRQIFDDANKLGVPCRTLPGINDLLEDRVDVKALRDVSLEDLLGRDPVQLDWPRIREGVAGKAVLISGAGGSIGSELCRQIARLNPKKLLLVEHSEFNLYNIEMELQNNFSSLKIIPCLVSVTDEVELSKIFQTHRIDTVFHAAAYKHVPMLESQCRIAMQNNILGTYRLASQAVNAGVSHFVLISTDKAVRPTNIMGSTKRAAEVLCQALNGQSQTKFIAVRFGNVLGSAGSVVPLFKKQLEKGGPLTVTHPDITRFFMTIPEACQLILQASVVGDGGEIFVLDMGEPIKIRYLAEQMILLSGLTIEEVGIDYVGLRPGEKLYEELFYEKETLKESGYQKLLMAQMNIASWDTVSHTLSAIKSACIDNDEESLLQHLRVLVPEYKQAEKTYEIN